MDPLFVSIVLLAALAILLTALLDDLLVALAGGAPSYDSAEAAASAFER